MALADKKLYSVNDIYSLPEGQRAELIDGRLFLMAAPSRMHQEIAGELYRSISNHIHGNRGSCRVYAAPFAVFLSQDGMNYVEPDISVVCDRNRLSERGCEGAPDWIIEIVSLGSQRMDYMVKLFKYRTAGVREYWIVDPRDRTVAVYDFEHDDMERYAFSDAVRGSVLKGFTADFPEIMADAGW